MRSLRLNFCYHRKPVHRSFLDSAQRAILLTDSHRPILVNFLEMQRTMVRIILPEAVRLSGELLNFGGQAASRLRNCSVVEDFIEGLCLAFGDLLFGLSPGRV
jgi:hypothetical protein